MKLQHGKRYLLRSGLITPPMNERHGGISYECEQPDGEWASLHMWEPNGKYRDVEKSMSEFQVRDMDVISDAPVVTDDCLDAMVRFGGSFVVQLVSLYRKAHLKNRDAIVLMWGHLFVMYSEIADQETEKLKNSGHKYRSCVIDEGSVFGWNWVHEDFDGSPDAFGEDDDGCGIRDHRRGKCRSFEECIEEIDLMYLEGDMP